MCYYMTAKVGLTSGSRVVALIRVAAITRNYIHYIFFVLPHFLKLFGWVCIILAFDIFYELLNMEFAWPRFITWASAALAHGALESAKEGKVANVEVW